MSRTILHRDDNGDVVIQTVVHAHQWCEHVAGVTREGLTADVRATVETLHFEEPDDAAKVRSLAPAEYLALKRVLEAADGVLATRPDDVDETVWAVATTHRLRTLGSAVAAVNRHALP